MDTVAFHTLGCKVNQTETAALQNLFESVGYRTVPFSAPADVYIINTCTVTHLGDRKSRQIIRRARRINADAVIVVTGCYAQVSADDVMAIPEVDIVVGTHAREKLPELVLEAKETGRFSSVKPIDEKTGFESLPAAQTGSRTRAFLKIQEGCRQYCSYCIVPYARGPLHSRHLDDALAEAQRLAESGFRELVLTGVHLGSYGVDLPGNIALSDLISRISPLQGIERIRISSIEPTEITPDLVETIMQHKKVCRHLHIPLQSGDDQILRRMNRKYDSGEFLYLMHWLRAQIPEIALTTDIMVGFPGETEEHFANSVRLIEKIGFSRLHIFKYSPRKGTPAAKFPDQVPPSIKEERARHLAQLGDELAASYRERFFGKTVGVLFEEKAGRGKLAGLTEHYIRVAVKAPESLLGELIQVEITANGKNELAGEII